MSRTRVALGSLVGAGVIHFALVACEPAFPTLDAAIPNDGGVLDAMRDAFVDAVGTMRDAEVREAQAQDSGSTPSSMEMQCTQSINTGSATYYFAELPTPGIHAENPATVNAWVCDPTFSLRELFCAGATCTGYEPLGLRCTQASAYVATDRIIVSCGFSQGALNRRWGRAVVRRN